jgi:hypothetical protein
MGARATISAVGLTLFVLAVPKLPAQTTPSSPPQAQQKASQEQTENTTEPRAASTESLGDRELSQDELRDLVRRAMENDQDNYKKQKDLTHVERQVTRHLDSQGNIKKTETVTREILILYGDRIEHVIERDDKALNPDEKRKEDAKFDKEVGKLEKESPEQRQKRLAKYEEESRKEREFVREVANAFNFKFVGEEMIDGRPAYLVSGEPRSDYHPASREGKILTKTRGRMWIDIASSQWVKIDAEFTETVSFGWFLARVHPGTRVSAEQHLFRDEVWVPSEVKFNLDARVGLLKQLYENVDVTFRDWRKFSTDAKIINYSEVK